MKTIWKIPIPIQDNIAIELPAGATVLTIQTQHNEPCLWALVEPDAPKKRRIFHLYWTDHPIEDADHLSYVGTFQMRGGALAFHLFERSESSEYSRAIEEGRVSAVDQRRLRDGARALALPEPKTREEIDAALVVISDGILAMQSLDDLGEEANKKAHADLAELFRREERLKAQLKEQGDTR